jgi:hypothetical protein
MLRSEKLPLSVNWPTLGDETKAPHVVYMDAVNLPILLAILGVAAAALLVRTILHDIRRRKAADKAMADLGFKPCPDDVASLQEKVRELHSDSDVEVRHAEKLATRGGPVYRYEVHSADRETPDACEELLFPLARKSERPLVLFMMPDGLAEGFGRTMLEKLTTALAPRDLAPLTVPTPLRATIFNALGPAGTTLEDLIDDRDLTALRNAARHGFSVARAVGASCALEVLSDYGRRALPAFDLAAAARYVRELAERHGAR